MKSVKIGLIGAGTVGKGVIEIINNNGNLIADRTGVSLELAKVCDKDKNAFKGVNLPDGAEAVQDALSVLDDPGIDIIVELIGGVSPAKEIILKALANKKHVVTANKALLSECWKDIFKAASDNEVFVSFEASVAGGIPIIRAIRESFVSNNLELIFGIVNGTCNFILTMMADEGMSFKEALTIAQEKGIAESDPTLDISGKDSAHKLAILSLLGFGIEVSPEDIFTEGIENIAPQDIAYAKEWGFSIKLLAICKNTSSGLQLRVHPTLLPSYHLLANVKGEDNAIFVKGDFAGESLFYGKGAGARPTATSVIGDVVEIAKHVAFYGKEKAAPYKLFYDEGALDLVDPEKISLPYYIRFSVIDKPGVLAGISSVLANNNISIASMSQEERKKGEQVPVIMLTHNAVEGDMRKAIAEIDKMGFVTDKTVVIRVEA